MGSIARCTIHRHTYSLLWLLLHVTDLKMEWSTALPALLTAALCLDPFFVFAGAIVLLLPLPSVVGSSALLNKVHKDELNGVVQLAPMVPSATGHNRNLLGLLLFLPLSSHLS